MEERAEAGKGQTLKRSITTVREDSPAIFSVLGWGPPLYLVWLILTAKHSNMNINL